MAYTTAQLNGIVGKLETALSRGFAEVTHEGNHFVYRSVSEILKGIAYFKAQYDNATDAPSPAPAKVRTYYLFGGKGIGF